MTSACRSGAAVGLRAMPPVFARLRSSQISRIPQMYIIRVLDIKSSRIQQIKNLKNLVNIPLTFVTPAG